jgi:uncharacterized membrane protein
MSSNIVVPTSIVGSLLRAFRAHVRGRMLPAPVSLTFDAKAREIAIQPEGTVDLVQQLGNVLLWAYTLSDVTAKWWRTDGERLHISIRGRTAVGARVRVYGGGHFSECLRLVQLAPNETDGVSVDELYQFHSQLRADGEHEQHEQEVA